MQSERCTSLEPGKREGPLLQFDHQVPQGNTMSAVLEKRPVPKKTVKQSAQPAGLTVAEAMRDFIGCNVDADLPVDAARRHKFYLHAALKKKYSR